MKNLLRIEEALMLGLAIYLNSYLPFAAWIFWAIFLLPDIGMLGYLMRFAYLLAFAHISRRVTVRLNTNLLEVESLSKQK